jgi:hypothetical protein
MRASSAPAPVLASWPSSPQAAESTLARRARLLSARSHAKEVEREAQDRYRLALVSSIEEELLAQKVSSEGSDREHALLTAAACQPALQLHPSLSHLSPHPTHPTVTSVCSSPLPPSLPSSPHSAPGRAPARCAWQR